MAENVIETLKSRTKVNKSTSQYNWEIDNFDALVASEDSFTSSIFPTEEIGGRQFYIFVQKESRKYDYIKQCQIHVLRFFLKNQRPTENPKFVYYTFLVKSSCSLEEDIFQGTMASAIDEEEVGKVSIDKICPKEDWLKFHVNHKLQITVDLSIVDSSETSLINSTLKYVETENSVHKKKPVLEDEELKDFFFNVQNKKIGAHKVLLAMESPVFAAMFRTRMKESLSSTAIIDDIKPEVFEKMLDFIYYKELSRSDLITSAVDLLIVAHKYQIQKLQIVCIQFLYNDLNKNNARQIFDIATLYGIDKLKTRALQFLKCN